MKGIEVIVLVLITSGLMITAEHFFRGRSWPPVSGWWKRAFLLNTAQAVVIFVIGSLLKLWIPQYSIWNLESLGSMTTKTKERRFGKLGISSGCFFGRLDCNGTWVQL